MYNACEPWLVRNFSEYSFSLWDYPKYFDCCLLAGCKQTLSIEYDHSDLQSAIKLKYTTIDDMHRRNISLKQVITVYHPSGSYKRVYKSK